MRVTPLDRGGVAWEEVTDEVRTYTRQSCNTPEGKAKRNPMAIQYIFNKYLHYMLHAAKGKPLTQEKRNSPSSWSLLTCIEDRPYPKNHTTIWKLWTIMKAKKERYMMLGAWTGGEMGLAEQWNRPQRRKKRKGAEFCSQRGHAWWKEDTQQRTARGKAAWAQKAGSKGSKPGGVQGPDLGRFGMHPKGNWKSQKAFKLRVKWSDLHFQQVTLITTSTQETRVDLGRSFRNLLPPSRQEMILAVSR